MFSFHVKRPDPRKRFIEIQNVSHECDTLTEVFQLLAQLELESATQFQIFEDGRLIGGAGYEEFSGLLRKPPGNRLSG